jgi:hypothetical protein
VLFGGVATESSVYDNSLVDAPTINSAEMATTASD